MPNTLARNIHARVLRIRASSANVEVKIDTRPKIVKPKKGRNAYRRSKSKQCMDTRSANVTFQHS
jgi:hypothetical protein